MSPYPLKRTCLEDTATKINLEDISAAGIRVIIRDSEGQVIGALSEKINLPPSVEEVEAVACRRAIALASEIGLQDVVFKGDDEIIIKSLISNGIYLAHFGHLVASSLRTVAFNHVCRIGIFVCTSVLVRGYPS